MPALVDPAKCTGCEDCIAVCPTECISLVDGKANLADNTNTLVSLIDCCRVLLGAASDTGPFTLDNAKQAILAFKGDVYTGLEADTLTAAQLQFAQQHLRILSGLYGLLRPLDLMQPYRLEMGIRFANPGGSNTTMQLASDGGISYEVYDELGDAPAAVTYLDGHATLPVP